MNNIVFNNLVVGEGQQFSGPAVKLKGSNAFESLLHPNLGSGARSGAGKASFEVVANLNEQKAFATHVLSYVDVVSAGTENNSKQTCDNIGKLYSSSSTTVNTSTTSIAASTDSAELLLPSQDVRRTIGSLKEDKSRSLVPLFFSSFYEKIKVSIFGVDEKTLVIRDYYTKTNYSAADFKMGGRDEMPAIKKLFHNGVEK